ncbi:MAG: hypothetical protein K0U29_07700 [Gammaproteobacteria bacterium]|nr:hypothetical protein [Gammaproteobacteria bacterium]MCH9744797.1 hypothetical protein [Gammaproteobacteria bacterium]
MRGPEANQGGNGGGAAAGGHVQDGEAVNGGAHETYEWNMRRVLGWGTLGFFVSLPTMFLTMYGREKIPLDTIKSTGEFFHRLSHDTGKDAWIAGISSIVLNTPLAAMTMQTALPMAWKIITCRYKEEYRRAAYLAAFIAVPAALTFAEIARETFEFSWLQWIAATDNLVAYYAARTFPLIYLLRLAVSPELRTQTWLSWILPVLEPNDAAGAEAEPLLAPAEEGVDDGEIVRLLRNSHVNRTKLTLYSIWFVVSAVAALWLGFAGSPAFAQKFLAALQEIFWKDVDAENYQSGYLVLGYTLSAFPSFALYTSFSFDFFYRLVPGVATSFFQIDTKKPHAIKKALGLFLFAGLTAWMAYESGYGMKEVGYSANNHGVLDYLGDFKNALPVSMLAGAGFVNWKPVMYIIWSQIYALRDTSVVNDTQREMHKCFSDKETDVRIKGQDVRNTLPHLNLGIFNLFRPASDVEIRAGRNFLPRCCHAAAAA